MDLVRARNVVLGAGAMGTATAYHLARRGEPVLLVEQFRIGHDRGSSHGEARIIRHSYADRHCARLMIDSFGAWRDLEADAGQQLYTRTGGVSFGPPETGYVSAVSESLDEIDVPHRLMSGGALNRTWPVFDVPVEYDVVFEPDAGMLAASRAVALQVELARRLGDGKTQVLEGCPVRGIDLDAERPTLVAADLRIVADRLIVTAGPWTGRLLPALGDRLRPTRQQVLYLLPSDPARFALDRFPLFIFMGKMDAYYGMPTLAGNGVKVARHGGHDVDPDSDDRTIGDAYRAEVRHFLRGHLPTLADAPIGREEVCLYTMAPDERFLVDFAPGRRDVIVASPCSGHGFKFSNLIGRVLADLALDGRTAIDIRPWGLDES